MTTATPEQRRKLNRVVLWVGLFGLPYFFVYLVLLGVLARRFSLTELHPLVAFVATFTGVSLFFFPVWWLSHRLRRRYGLVCETCGAWLSFRRSERGECHRGHAQTLHEAA
jgi:hypothetical protein